MAKMDYSDLQGRIDVEVQRQVDEAVKKAEDDIAAIISKLCDPAWGGTQFHGNNAWCDGYSAYKVAALDAILKRISGQTKVVPTFPRELWSNRRKIKLEEIMGTMNALQRMLMTSADYVGVEKPTPEDVKP